MLRKDLIYRNPLRVMGDRSDDILPEGGFGAVLARAGLGKTALLVQLALDSLLQNKHVLHISLDDPVKKVCLWYEEVFKNISSQYDVKQMNELWESILPERLIMTFNVDSFSVPKLDERLTDLTEQNIIHPKMMLIDGLPFAETDRTALEDLKSLAKNHGMHVWFTVTTHRHEASDGNGMPHPLADVEDLFEVAFQLQPDGKQIHVAALKGGMASAAPTLLLDPSTMLINETDDAQKSSNSK